MSAAVVPTLAVPGTGPVVTVLHSDGSFAPNVAVVCMQGASGTGLTDEQGRVALPEGCLEVECMRGGLVTGRATIMNGAATCTVAEAAVIRGQIRGLTGGERWYSVQAVSSDARSVARSATADSTSPRFRLEVPAGSYELRIFRWGDWWSCSGALGSLTAGEKEVVADWREPAEVRGIVLDPAGRPFGRVLLRVVYEDGGEAPEPAGRTLCELDRNALDVISERDGRFVALVDPERAYRIVADEAWQPATVRLDADVERVEERSR